MRRVAIIRQSVPIVSLQRVAFDAQAIVMPAGMALTLNGVVQGFIADKVAVLLTAEGLTDILINTAEFRALGHMPGAAGWPLKLAAGGEVVLETRAWRHRHLWVPSLMRPARLGIS